MSQSKKLKVIVGTAKNIASSRRVYCEVHCLDREGQTIGEPQKTAHTKGTSTPSWNSTLTFDIVKPDDFSGIAVSVYEHHRVFADKFLGIIRLKFNTQMLLQGVDTVDSWFPLSSTSAKKKVSGELHLKVLYGDATQRPKIKLEISEEEDEKKDDKKSSQKDKDTVDDDDDDFVIVPSEKHDLQKSSKWATKDTEVKLKNNTFVVIEDDDDITPVTTRKNTATNSGTNSATSTITTAATNTATTTDTSSTTSSTSTTTPTTATTNSLNKATSSKEEVIPGIPKARKAQIEAVQKISQQCKNSLIRDVENDNGNIAFKMVHPKNPEISSQVTLLIPESIQREEFLLWTADGAIELGRTGSIFVAMNKAISSFAKKNNLEPMPVFPEGTDIDKTAERKALLYASGWSKIGTASPKPTKSKKVVEQSDEDDSDEVLEVSEEFNPPEPELEIKADVSAGKAALDKHLKEFSQLHGDSEIGIFQKKQNFTVRLALTPSNFMETLMCQIWQINFNLKIILEVEIASPYYMESMKPPTLRFYQTPDKNLNKEKLQVIAFGVKWFLEKRAEFFLQKNWPPQHTHLFLDLIAFIIDKIMNCTNNCMICDKLLDIPMLKPSICDNQICVFSHEQFGLGVDPAAEIASEPEVVDLLLSFSKAVAASGDPRRFSPFPSNIEVRWKDPVTSMEIVKKFKESTGAEPTAADLTIVSQAIDQIPPVKDMLQWKTSAEIKEQLDKRNRMSYALLRWILTSNLAHIAKLKPTEQISAMGTVHQYLLLSAAPAKERKFQLEKKKHGSFWAFHGSAFGNWHSIVRCGLRNLSGTALMSTGAVYGNGIYMAGDSNTSIGYAKGQSGWANSILVEGGSATQLIQCLALCEVVNAGYKANPYYVVPNEDHVATRYLFVFNHKHPHRQTQASSLTPPQTEYIKYQKKY